MGLDEVDRALPAIIALMHDPRVQADRARFEALPAVVAEAKPPAVRLDTYIGALKAERDRRQIHAAIDQAAADFVLEPGERPLLEAFAEGFKAGRDAAVAEIVKIAEASIARRAHKTDYKLGYADGSRDVARRIVLDAHAAMEAERA